MKYSASSVVKREKGKAWKAPGNALFERERVIAASRNVIEMPSRQKPFKRESITIASNTATNSANNSNTNDGTRPGPSTGRNDSTLSKEFKVNAFHFSARPKRAKCKGTWLTNWEGPPVAGFMSTRVVHRSSKPVDHSALMQKLGAAGQDPAASVSSPQQPTKEIALKKNLPQDNDERKYVVKLERDLELFPQESYQTPVMPHPPIHHPACRPVYRPVFHSTFIPVSTASSVSRDVPGITEPGDHRTKEIALKKSPQECYDERKCIVKLKEELDEFHPERYKTPEDPPVFRPKWMLSSLPRDEPIAQAGNYLEENNGDAPIRAARIDRFGGLNTPGRVTYWLYRNYIHIRTPPEAAPTATPATGNRRYESPITAEADSSVVECDSPPIPSRRGGVSEAGRNSSHYQRNPARNDEAEEPRPLRHDKATQYSYDDVLIGENLFRFRPILANPSVMANFEQQQISPFAEASFYDSRRSSEQRSVQAGHAFVAFKDRDRIFNPSVRRASLDATPQQPSFRQTERNGDRQQSTWSGFSEDTSAVKSEPSFDTESYVPPGKYVFSNPLLILTPSVWIPPLGPAPTPLRGYTEAVKSRKRRGRRDRDWNPQSSSACGDGERRRGRPHSSTEPKEFKFHIAALQTSSSTTTKGSRGIWRPSKNPFALGKAWRRPDRSHSPKEKHSNRKASRQWSDNESRRTEGVKIRSVDSLRKSHRTGRERDGEQKYRPRNRRRERAHDSAEDGTLAPKYSRRSPEENHRLKRRFK